MVQMKSLILFFLLSGCSAVRIHRGAPPNITSKLVKEGSTANHGRRLAGTCYANSWEEFHFGFLVDVKSVIEAVCGNIFSNFFTGRFSTACTGADVISGLYDEFTKTTMAMVCYEGVVENPYAQAASIVENWLNAEPSWGVTYGDYFRSSYNDEVGYRRIELDHGQCTNSFGVWGTWCTWPIEARGDVADAIQTFILEEFGSDVDDFYIDYVSGDELDTADPLSDFVVSHNGIFYQYDPTGPDTYCTSDDGYVYLTVCETSVFVDDDTDEAARSAPELFGLATLLTMVTITSIRGF